MRVERCWRIKFFASLGNTMLALADVLLIGAAIAGTGGTGAVAGAELLAARGGLLVVTTEARGIALGARTLVALGASAHAELVVQSASSGGGADQPASGGGGSSGGSAGGEGFPLSNRGTVRTTWPGKPRRTGVPDGSEKWSSRPGRKTSIENARGHAGEHAAEFGLSERRYIEEAKEIVSDPPTTVEVFVRESGEVMIYDPPTRTFAIRTPEGVPATMYKADMAYWERQLAEYGGRRVTR